jgi:hypothetical protein
MPRPTKHKLRLAENCRKRHGAAYRLNDGPNHNLTLKQVEWTVKKYKSHRRIPDTFDDIIEAYRIATTET